MSNNYWARVLTSRINRRRALAASGAGAVGAALLAACGGDSGTEDASGLLSTPQDTSAKAVPGGIWQTATSEPVNLDPHQNTRSPDSQYYSIVYSQLLRFGKSTDGTPPPVTAISGDAAESFESAPDGMQLTLKLRQNHKFDPRPPTSGRAMDAQDVKLSFDRTSTFSPFAGDMLRSKSEFGPVESVSTPDNRTVVFKLAFPYKGIIEMLAYHTYFWVMPREVDQFNSKGETRGSGPFFLTEWRPSNGLTYVKNPDWYEKGKPYLDGINGIILADYPSALAQFEAGAIWDYAVNQEDVLRVKRDHPEMVMARDQRAPTGTNITHFWMADSRPDSPMRDVRLRQATAMAIDRDLVIDTLYNVQGFRNAGIPQETHWNSHLGGVTANYVDPETSEMGEGAKYFQYNPVEAKKLLSAAGYSGAKIAYWNRGPEIDTLHLTMGQMITEAGFNIDQQGLDTQTVWRQTCQITPTIGEGWTGWCHQSSGAFNDAEHLASKYTPEGKFRMWYKELPVMTDLARKARFELDDKRQSEMIKQIQREAAKLWYDMPMAGYADQYTLSWPWLKNYGVFKDGGYNPLWSSSKLRADYWYDATAKKA